MWDAECGAKRALEFGRGAGMVRGMSVTISIPDEFADVLGASAEEREQRAREALALELYREGKISLRRMGELAGVGGDYWAAENFRVLHKAPLNYSLEDLDAERRAADVLRGR